MKKKGVTVLVGGMMFMFVFLFSTCKKKDVIATVNGEPISKAEFERVYTNVENYYSNVVGISVDDPKFQEMMSKVRQQLLDSMIDEKLLLQEARRRNITVTPEEVNAHIQMLKQKYGEEAFAGALAQQGLTEEDYRKELTEQMIVNHLRDELAKGVKITEEDAKKYYEKHKDKYTQPEMVRVRHILVGTEDEAKKVLSRLKKGEDFEKLAKEVSIDTGTKDKGGDVGYFSRGRMVKEFEDAAFGLKKKGEISGIVKTKFGYHILQLVDRKPAQTMEFEKIKDRVTNEAQNDKVQTKMNELVKKLREKAEIQVME